MRPESCRTIAATMLSTMRFGECLRIAKKFDGEGNFYAQADLGEPY